MMLCRTSNEGSGRGGLQIQVWQPKPTLCCRRQTRTRQQQARASGYLYDAGAVDADDGPAGAAAAVAAEAAQRAAAAVPLQVPQLEST